MKLYEICFSPTGGTKKAADMLVNGLTGESQRSSQRQDERRIHAAIGLSSLPRGNQNFKDPRDSSGSP